MPSPIEWMDGSFFKRPVWSFSCFEFKRSFDSTFLMKFKLKLQSSTKHIAVARDLASRHLLGFFAYSSLSPKSRLATIDHLVFYPAFPYWALMRKASAAFFTCQHVSPSFQSQTALSLLFKIISLLPGTSLCEPSYVCTLERTTHSHVVRRVTL